MSPNELKRQEERFARLEARKLRDLSVEQGFPRVLTESEIDRMRFCFGVLDLAQNDFARLAHLTPSYISGVIRGQTQVTHKTYLCLLHAIDSFDIPLDSYNKTYARGFPRKLNAEEIGQIKSTLSELNLPMTFVAEQTGRSYATVVSALGGRRPCSFPLYQAMLRCLQEYSLRAGHDFLYKDLVVTIPQCDPPNEVSTDSRNFVVRADLRSMVSKQFDFLTFSRTGLAPRIVTMQVVGSPKAGKSLALREVGVALAENGVTSSVFRTDRYIEKPPYEVFSNWIYEQTGTYVELPTQVDTGVLARKIAHAFENRGRHTLIYDGLEKLPDNHIRYIDHLLEAFRQDVGKKVNLGVVTSTSTSKYEEPSKSLIYGGPAYTVRPFTREEVLQLTCKFSGLAAHALTETADKVYTAHQGGPLQTQEALYILDSCKK